MNKNFLNENTHINPTFIFSFFALGDNMTFGNFVSFLVLEFGNLHFLFRRHRSNMSMQ